MIQLIKLSGDTILLNEDQIKYITFIPETKIFMMSGDYYLVKESGPEIINQIITFKRKLFPPMMNLQEVQNGGWM
ncbi:MAG: flagellar FlbD family protein [Oscillibacter sp.]|nr:flagellar FlbD family protein [Oscillibacter sp.]